MSVRPRSVNQLLSAVSSRLPAVLWKAPPPGDEEGGRRPPAASEQLRDERQILRVVLRGRRPEDDEILVAAAIPVWSAASRRSAAVSRSRPATCRQPVTRRCRRSSRHRPRRFDSSIPGTVTATTGSGRPPRVYRSLGRERRWSMVTEFSTVMAATHAGGAANPARLAAGEGVAEPVVGRRSPRRPSCRQPRAWSRETSRSLRASRPAC